MMPFNDKPSHVSQFKDAWLERMSKETRRLMNYVVIIKKDFPLYKLNIPEMVMIYPCAEIAICQLKSPRNAAAD